MAFSFFNTAPKLFGDKFVKLAKEGHLPEIMEAIYDERSKKSGTGTSKNGKITVTRAGAFSRTNNG